MTEFETATLALQQGQLWAAIAIPVVAGLVGFLQAGVVIYGIRAMIRANEGRAEADRQRARQEDARHAEAMTALRAVIQGLEGRAEADQQRARQEDARHAEAMARLDQQGETLRAVVQGLDRQGAALEAALKGRT